jgi:hypothetical protein
VVAYECPIARGMKGNRGTIRVDIVAAFLLIAIGGCVLSRIAPADAGSTSSSQAGPSIACHGSKQLKQCLQTGTQNCFGGLTLMELRDEIGCLCQPDNRSDACLSTARALKERTADLTQKYTQWLRHCTAQAQTRCGAAQAGKPKAACFKRETAACHEPSNYPEDVRREFELNSRASDFQQKASINYLAGCVPEPTPLCKKLATKLVFTDPEINFLKRHGAWNSDREKIQNLSKIVLKEPTYVSQQPARSAAPDE